MVCDENQGGRLFPRTKGVGMNPVDHPFGGKTKPGTPKSVSRHAPLGAKDGSISPRRMGKRKGWKWHESLSTKGKLSKN